MLRVHALLSHLAPSPTSSAPQTHATRPTSAIDTSHTGLRATLQTQSPLVQQLDHSLATASSTDPPVILASPALPASLSAAEWLALPPHTLLGNSASLLVTQLRIDAFAAVTGDAQWIHSHQAAQMGSPFGRPIAHGFLVLALLVPMVAEVLPSVEGLSMTVNFGLNRVRWTRPVHVDERVVGTMWLEKAERLQGGVVHNVLKVEVRVVGADGRVNSSDKPVMVAEWVARFYETPSS